MINAMSSRIKREEGFTLIELMIVMVVLGILAGIVIFAVGGFSDSADTSVVDANAKICATAEAAVLASEETSDPKVLADFMDDPSVCS